VNYRVGNACYASQTALLIQVTDDLYDAQGFQRRIVATYHRQHLPVVQQVRQSAAHHVSAADNEQTFHPPDYP
jgi:hypothetical protein